MAARPSASLTCCGNFDRMSLPSAKRLIRVILVLSLMAPAALSEDDSAASIANPQYLAWEKFKLGSFSTWALDLDGPSGPIHVEMTTVLRRIDDSGVTLDIKTTRI